MKFQKAKTIKNQHGVAEVKFRDAVLARVELEKQRDESDKLPTALRDGAAKLLERVGALRAKADKLEIKAKDKLKRAESAPVFDADALHRALSVEQRCASELHAWSQQLTEAEAVIADVAQKEATKKVELSAMVQKYKDEASKDSNLTDEQRAKLDYVEMAKQGLKAKSIIKVKTK